MKKRYLLCISAALGLCVFCRPPAHSEVTSRMNFQGRLVDPATKNPKNGPFNMKFRVCNHQSASCAACPGAVCLWEETQSGVQVTNGLFAVQLGSVTALDAGIFSGATAFLEIEVAGETLSPRERLVNAPYAFRAAVADTLQAGATFYVSSATVEGYFRAGTMIANNGNVSIGTVNPAGLLSLGSGQVLATYPLSGSSAAPQFSFINRSASGLNYFNDDEALELVRSGGTILRMPYNIFDFQISNTSNMRLTSVGLGIGTTGPQAQLHISSGNAVASSTVLLLSSGTTPGQELLVVKGNGNVGIGKTAPTEQLSVRATSDPKIALGVYTDASGRGIALRTTDYITGSAGSSFRIGMGSGYGNTYVSLGQHNGGENGTYGNMVLQQSGGNVGIGTTAPGTKLEVKDGNIYINNASGNSAINLYQGSLSSRNSNTALQIGMDSAGSDGIYFRTYSGGYDDRMVIKADGKIGIGTAPVVGLDVLSNTGVRFNGTSGGPMYLYLSADAGEDNSDKWVEAVSDGGLFSLQSAESGTWVHKLVVQTDGNVGIGTTEPGAKLDVVSAASSMGILQVRSTAGAGALAGIKFSANTINNRAKAAISFMETNSGAHFTGDLIFALNNAPGSSAEVDTTDERMRITKTGTVGIGITAPNEKLSVIGASYFGDTVDDGVIVGYVPSAGLSEIIGVNHAFGIYNDLGIRVNNSTQLYLKTDGAVGVATTNPVYKLDVAGEARATGGVRLGSGADAGNENDPSVTSSGNTHAGLYFASSGTGLGSGTGKMLFLDSSGDVGVGTTNPGAKLDVNGGIVYSGALSGPTWVNLSGYSTCGGAATACGTQSKTCFMVARGGTVAVPPNNSGYTTSATWSSIAACYTDFGACANWGANDYAMCL